MYRLVIIDDEYIVVEGIKAMIARQKLDYEVTGWAYDGITGLQVVREKKPDLVITDIRIPGLDGLSLIEAAKEFCKDTAFVVISGYTEFEYARRALSLGVKGYIDKPISIDKLKKVLDKVEKECFHAVPDAEEEAIKKAEMSVSKAVDRGILYLVEGNTEEYKKAAMQAVELMNEVCQKEAVQGEIFKFLCVINDIALDVLGGDVKESFVSYKEYKLLETLGGYARYAEKVIEDIAKQMSSDRTGSNHRVILELLEYIHGHYNEDIGLNELACRVGMNAAYLSVLFKDEVGMSYIKYLTELRIKNAKKLLKEGYKVNEVSEMVGYSNYRYFCDIFKKKVDQTPNEYKGVARKKKI